MTAILPDIIDEARRVLDAAGRDGTTLALLGGIAVRLHASEVPPSLDHEYHDIDFAVPKGRGRPAAKLLDSLVTAPQRIQRAAGPRTAVYLDPGARPAGRRVHRLVPDVPRDPVRGPAHPREQTVPLAELVLTKLQIIELDEKDVRDTVLLFYGHDVSDHDRVDQRMSASPSSAPATGALWRTITHNLERCTSTWATTRCPRRTRGAS